MALGWWHSQRGIRWTNAKVGGTLRPRRVLWQAMLAAVEEEGDEAVRDAKRKEEERLSEDANTADILAENARLVAEAQRRANSGVG